VSTDPTPGEVRLSEAVRALLNDGASGGYWSDGSTGWVRGIREDRLRALLDAHSTTAGASGELTEEEREALTLAMCAPDPDRAPVTEIQLMYLVAAVERIVTARLAARDAEVEELAWAEMLTHQECAAKKHPDWFIDSEHNILCPWCRAEAAEAEVADLRAKVETQRIAAKTAQQRATYAMNHAKTAGDLVGRILSACLADEVGREPLDRKTVAKFAHDSAESLSRAYLNARETTRDLRAALGGEHA